MSVKYFWVYYNCEANCNLSLCTGISKQFKMDSCLKNGDMGNLILYTLQQNGNIISNIYELGSNCKGEPIGKTTEEGHENVC